MIRLLALAPLAAMLLQDAPTAPQPSRAPAQFVSNQYALTFRTPEGATSCRLPRNFVGAYHGPVLFLTPPRNCDDRAGSWIAVGYSVSLGDNAPPPDPCQSAGTIRLFGSDRTLCRTENGNLITFTTSAAYAVRRDGDSEAALYLTTTPGRMDADLATLRMLADSLRPCRLSGPDAEGTGAPCPADAQQF